jgi:cytoskeleton protein RodZ
MMTTSAQNLGKELRTKREQLGYSLKDVAEHTRIRKVYLESLELGQFEALPGQAYLIGFVRVYAHYLGLDSDDLLAQLDAPQEIENAQSVDSDAVNESEVKSGAQPGAGKSWGAFVLGFMVVIALGSLIYFIPSFFKSEVPVETSAEDVLKVQETASKQRPDVVVIEEILAKPNPESPVESEAKPVVVITEGSAAEKKSVQAPLLTIPQTGSTLRMLALTESSLIIYVDDRKPHEYKLYEGLDLTWKIKKTVKVEMAEPDVARFWLGRQELKLGALDDFYLSTAPGE